MSRRFWRQGFALIIGALARHWAYAQPTVELHAATTDAFVREAFRVEIAVHNFSACEAPQFPQVPDCTVNALSDFKESTIQEFTFGRSRTRRTRVYSFELTPQKAGELIIPPVPVNVDGQTLQTAPVRLSVSASDADELLWVEITGSQERVFVGQRVPLALTIGVKPASAFGRALSADEMRRFFTEADLGPFDGKVRIGQRERTRTDGSTQRYYTYEASADYVPDRPGPLSFDNISVGLNYPTRFERDRFWGHLEVAAARRLRARPQVADVEVLPLPLEGRPPNFTGAVGAYNLTVAANPTGVRVGDPIELTIEIRGDGPLETLPPPALDADPRLTEAFRVPQEALAGEVRGSRKRFTQTIRAKSAAVHEIPALEYPYFDPQRGAYVVARSNAIPLNVTAAEKLDAADVASAPPPAQRIQPAGPQPLDGLRGNATSEVELLATTRSVRIIDLAIATLLPPVIYVLTWGGRTYLRSRGADVAGRRRQNALKIARRRIDHAQTLPRGEMTRAVGAALGGYLADRLNEPPARFIGRAAVDFLESCGVPQEIRARWADVIDRCEQAAFGGQNSDARVIADQARECLALLERERL